GPRDEPASDSRPGRAGNPAAREADRPRDRLAAPRRGRAGGDARLARRRLRIRTRDRLDASLSVRWTLDLFAVVSLAARALLVRRRAAGSRSSPSTRRRG